jgi:hypothetical protein
VIMSDDKVREFVTSPMGLIISLGSWPIRWL